MVGRLGGEERLFLGKTAGVGELICCFVLKFKYLTFFNAITYLPILEGDFSVSINKMSKLLNSLPFSFPRSGKKKI